MPAILGWALLLILSAAHAQEPSVRPMQQSDSYAYPADALRAILDDPAVFDFQLELAWSEDDTLQAWLVAVDADQQLVALVPGTFVDRHLDLSRLAALDDITAQELAKQPLALAAHILQPRIAAGFITNWADLRHSGVPLTDALSYDGEPLLLHTIEKAMIVDIIARPETSELVVFWGLTPNGKLTPVLMGVDRDGFEMVGSVGEIGFALDFTLPCPPTCRGKTPKAPTF